MIKNLNEDTVLKFKSLSPEEKAKKGTLGRLYGPIARIGETRNGRTYTQKLWEKLFESDLIKERFANGGIFGELCHPDYEEVDMSKVACIMPEPPVKDKDGQLIAYVDILDTPCGKVAYQLAKYGYRFGISSRGTGDLINGVNGDEVDPDTYELFAFDLVEVPAVETARLNFVESFDIKKHNKTLSETLEKTISKSTEDEKKLMTESLSKLGITLNEAGFWGYKFPYEVRKSLPDGGDYLLGGSRSFEGASQIAKNQMNSIADNSFMLPDEKRSHLNGVYIKHEEDGNLDLPDDVVLFRNNLLDADESFNVVGKDLKGNVIHNYEAETEEEAEKLKQELEDQGMDNNFMPHEKVEIIPDEVEERLISTLRDSQGINEEANGSVEDFINQMKNGDPEEVYRKAKGNPNAEKAYIKYKEECNGENCSDKEEVVDDKSQELVAEFQEALQRVKELEKDNLVLREQLSVCNAKEIELNGEVAKYKEATIKLGESARRDKKVISKLNESLNLKEKIITENSNEIRSLTEAKEANDAHLTQLIESNQNMAGVNEDLTTKLSTITEQFEEQAKQLESSKALVEKYKKSYSALKESYLNVKITNYGLDKAEVRQRLGESYKIKDIDSVCEDLSVYKNKMSKLPFVINEDTMFSVKKSDNEYIRLNENKSSDDYVSDSLLRMAELK